MVQGAAWVDGGATTHPVSVTSTTPVSAAATAVSTPGSQSKLATPGVAQPAVAGGTGGSDAASVGQCCCGNQRVQNRTLPITINVYVAVRAC